MGCLEVLYLHKFLLSKYLKFYGFGRIYKSIATIEFLKNKVVQRSPFRHWSEMVTLDEVLSLTTAPGAIMGKTWLSLVFRLENAFATIAHRTVLNSTDGHTKPQPQSPYILMQISLYIVLLTWNSIPSKTAFPWSDLNLELSQNFLR